MRLIIHDTNNQLTKYIKTNEDDIILTNNNMNYCIGCFGCWLKTPGTCILMDGYENNGHLLSQVDELIIVSKLTYGSYSSSIKNLLDRSISYVMPFFEIRNKQMHHQARYPNQLSLSAVFYGHDILDEEKQTANALVYANALNLNGYVKDIIFMEEVL